MWACLTREDEFCAFIVYTNFQTVTYSKELHDIGYFARFVVSTTFDLSSQALTSELKHLKELCCDYETKIAIGRCSTA